MKINKSNWEYNLRSTTGWKEKFGNCQMHIYYFYCIINSPINNIEIIVSRNINGNHLDFSDSDISKTIWISFPKDHKIISKLSEYCKSINIKCRLDNYGSGSKSIKIKLKKNKKLNKIIEYLEKLEEIYPYKILKKVLLGNKILFEDNNPLNYSNILKKIIKPDILKINFEILHKLDKEYHDKFISLLTFDEKLKILKQNKPFKQIFKKNDTLKNKENLIEYNFILLNNLINDNLNIEEINKLVNTVEFLTTKSENYDKIFDTTNVYLEYLNNLSVDNILKKLKDEDIINKRVFEIINYLYAQSTLSIDENIQLIKIINEKYQEKDKDLKLLKNKILCKLITNNTNLENEFNNEMTKYEDLFEGLIKFIINKHKKIELN